MTIWALAIIAVVLAAAYFVLPNIVYAISTWLEDHKRKDHA